jgi:hypothetical protein
MQTTAVIPYDVLDDACRITDGMDQSKLVVHTVVASNLKTVNPANIHLTIESKTKGAIPLKLGSKGQILDFPHDEELRSENPDIVSDQPKNTLGLGAWFYLPMPEELTFPYSRLADAVSEAKRGKEVADDVIKSGGYGQALPFTDNVPGVVLVFAKSSANSATLEIDASAGKKTYSANRQGDIFLPIDDALRAENPTVKISEKALWVVPYFDRGSGRQLAMKFSD